MQTCLIKKIFAGIDWWKLTSHDELLTSSVARGSDGKHLGQAAPPLSTYWLLAEPGNQYLLYARGVKDSLLLKPVSDASGTFHARLINPVKGIIREIEGEHRLNNGFAWMPPDDKEWVPATRFQTRDTR
jgi:hypothetical protein